MNERALDINEFAREVHENAVAHGWWEGERELYEIIALIHSEWSEALEEYRAGRPMFWYACEEAPDGRDHPCAPKDEYDCINFGKETECKYRGKKPEGVAVELIDGCIRILDWFGQINYHMRDLRGVVKYKIELPQLVAELHFDTSMATFYHNCVQLERLFQAMQNAFAWIRAQDLDPFAILLEKHEYNKTRPYRHGGKRC